MKSVRALSKYKNRVLASLPEAEMKRLVPHLLPLTLKVKRILHNTGEMIDTVYFLEAGITSVVVIMENGASVEVGLVGREGIVGLLAVMGSGRSPAQTQTYIQVPGHGYSVNANILREQFEASGALRLCFQRAMQGYLVQTAQTAACNRVHDLGERLARWLMMCYDREQSDRLNITHEFLAMMLGTRRSSVTVAADILQKAGLIVCRRGYVMIKDRKGLEGAACECYQVVHDEYAQLGLL